MSEKQLILQTSRSEKEGKEMVQAWSRCFPVVHGQDHAGADIHTAEHGEPYTTAGVHSLKEVAGYGVPTGSSQVPGAGSSQVPGSLEKNTNAGTVLL